MATETLTLRVQVRPWAKVALAIAYRAPWLCRLIGPDRLGTFLARYGVRITR